MILAPLVLALVFLGPMWLITLVVAAVAMLAAWEFLALTEHRGAKPPRVLTLGTIGLLFVGNYQWPDETATLFGLLSIVSAGLLHLQVACRSRALRCDGVGVCAVLSRAHLDRAAHAARSDQRPVSAGISVFNRVGWRYGGDVCRAGIGKAQVGAEPQSQQDLGGSDRLGGGRGRCGGNPAWH